MPVEKQPPDKSHNKVATSVDVARAAGFSQSTVSLVMSGKATGRISQQTQRLVERAAAELGYVPNMSARVLRGGTPSVIALAVPNVRQEFFGRVFLAAEHEARQQAMAVILIDTASDPDWVQRLIVMNRTRLLAGVIVYAQDPATTDRLSHAIDNLIPIETGFPRHGPSIEIDIATAMQDVAAHLYKLGHRRIGHARANMPRQTYRLRAHHLGVALADHGIEVQPDWHYESDFDLAAATERGIGFLKRSTVTAVFCDDDILAASLYRACRHLSLSIPRDLSIIGFNDVDVAQYLDPELTTVSIPAVDLGECAVRMLTASLRADEVPATTLPLTLRIRQSTGPVNSRS